MRSIFILAYVGEYGEIIEFPTHHQRFLPPDRWYYRPLPGDQNQSNMDSRTRRDRGK